MTWNWSWLGLQRGYKLANCMTLPQYNGQFGVALRKWNTRGGPLAKKRNSSTPKRTRIREGSGPGPRKHRTSSPPSVLQSPKIYKLRYRADTTILSLEPSRIPAVDIGFMYDWNEKIDPTRKNPIESTSLISPLYETLVFFTPTSPIRPHHLNWKTMLHWWCHF